MTKVKIEGKNNSREEVNYQPYLLDKLAHDDNSEEYQYFQANTEGLKKSNIDLKIEGKALTEAMTLKALKLGSKLHNGYISTLNCGHMLSVDSEGKVKGYRRCKQRICINCNRVRTGKLINDYLPAIRKMKDPHHVVLTIQNCLESELQETFEHITRTISKCIKKVKRDTGKVVNCARNIEATYVPKTDKWHPHSHLIVESQEHADMIRMEWIKVHDDIKIVDPAGQFVSKANENAVKELFKYCTKFITKTSGGDPLVYIDKIDAVLRALYNKKTFETYGNLRVTKNTEYDAYKADIKAMQESIKADKGNYIWDTDYARYIHSESGAFISDNPIPKPLKKIIRQGIVYADPESIKTEGKRLRIGNEVSKDITHISWQRELIRSTCD